MDPLTAYEAGSLGLGALGTVFGFANNASTNATSLKVARENNAFNEKMMDKQIAYNWDMWQANNEYNDPWNQRKRFEAAGINPALAMENQGAAEASGGSITPASASGNPTLTSYDPSASFNRMADILYQHDLKDLELKRRALENEDKSNEIAYNSQYRDLALRQGFQQLKNMVYQGLISANDYNEAISSWSLRRQSLDEDVRLKRGQADYQQQLLIGQVIDNKLKQFHLEKAPEEFKAQLSLIGAQITAALASGKMSLAMASKAFAEASESSARTFGLNIDNKQKKALFWSTVFAGMQSNLSSAAASRNEFQRQQDVYDMFNNPEKIYKSDRSSLRGLRSVFGTLIDPFKGVFK